MDAGLDAGDRRVDMSVVRQDRTTDRSAGTRARARWAVVGSGPAASSVQTEVLTDIEIRFECGLRSHRYRAGFEECAPCSLALIV